MRHQRHEEAGAHGTRLITAALVLIVGALSLAAVTPLVEHSPTGRSTHARQDEHPPSDGPRKDGGRLVRPDVVAPRLSVRCFAASGSRFHPGITAVRCSAADRAGNVARGGFAVVVRTMPGSMPPLLCFPDDPCNATREYAAWRFER